MPSVFSSCTARCALPLVLRVQLDEIKTYTGGVAEYHGLSRDGAAAVFLLKDMHDEVIEPHITFEVAPAFEINLGRLVGDVAYKCRNRKANKVRGRRVVCVLCTL